MKRQNKNLFLNFPCGKAGLVASFNQTLLLSKQCLPTIQNVLSFSILQNIILQCISQNYFSIFD